MDDYFNKPIFVLGLPRSGTSMVSGALAICGAWTGSTVPACQLTNPKGFFEHTVIRERVTKKLLQNFGYDPLGVRKLPPRHFNQSVKNLAEIIKGVIEADGYMSNRPWLYKDAKLTLIWRIYLQAFPDARWVIVKRDEKSFIDSCLKAHFMKQHSQSRIYWRRLAKSYQTRLNDLKKSCRHVYTLNTPEIIQGDLTGLQKLTSELELDFRIKELHDFIKPDFWSSKYKQ